MAFLILPFHLFVSLSAEERLMEGILVGVLPCLLWKLVFPSKIFSPLQLCLQRRGWDEQTEMLMLVVRLMVTARTFAFGASPSPCSWTVQPVLNSYPSCTFRVLCPSLHTLMLTQHYSNSSEHGSITNFQVNENHSGFSLIMSPCLTLPSWVHLDHLHCVTRARCFLRLCSLLKGLPQADWLLVHLHLPASLCLSMNRSKKYSPGFMLCWLNQSDQTALGHLFLGLDPS